MKRWPDRPHSATEPCRALTSSSPRALGLDVGPMSGFDEGRAEQEFFDNSDVKVNFIMSVGRGNPAKIVPKLPRLSFEAANQLIQVAVSGRNNVAEGITR